MDQCLAELVSLQHAGGADTPKVELLVIQPTPFCNISCRYCYLPDRGSKAVLSQETLTNLFAKLFRTGWVKERLPVVWHAGEPMVLPIAFYREAFRTIGRLKPDGIEISQGFQTNGTLIDAEWCEFFIEQRVSVGVSLDGPKRFHDLNRVTRSGHGTFERTMRGIQLLRQHGIPFHVISVLSPQSLGSASELFDFYVSEGIDQVCFNVEESEGSHVSKSFAEAGIEEAYRSFLAAFWQFHGQNPDKLKFVREIDHAIAQVIRPAHAPFVNQMVEPFSIVSMDWAGNIATFSPELLGLKNAEYGDFILGNVNQDALDDLPGSPVLHRMLLDIQAGVDACRASCEYFSVCGGGEPVNKLAETGTFRSTKTKYCRLTKMVVTDLILEALEQQEHAMEPLAS